MLDLLLQGGVRPTWRWDFTTGVVPSGATFTRGSAGWYFNSAGVLTQALTNVARFDYDPVTLSPLGYLAEMQSTNGLLRSEAFDNASWTKSSGTVTADQIVAPDGNTTMDLFTPAAANAQHYVTQAITSTADSYIGISLFVKANGYSFPYLNIQKGDGNTNNFATVVFDLVNGVVGETKLGTNSGAVASTSIRAIGNGIYRIAMVAKQGGGTPAILFGTAVSATGNTFSASGDIAFNANGTSGWYLWGAQVDSIGVGVTSYIPTAGSTVTRSADILTLPLGSLPGWNASKGGVLATTYRLHTLGPNATPTPVMIEDAGANNLAGIEAAYGGGSHRGELWSGGVAQSRPQGATVTTAFLRQKVAFGWSTSRTQLANDGSLAITASGTFLLPAAPTRIALGNQNGGGQLNGTLESIAYYAGARSDAFVQGVSR